MAVQRGTQPSADVAKPAAGRTPVSNLPPELAANQQYEILRELGRGGMGVVYLARNKLMDRLEVLKVVNKALLDNPPAPSNASYGKSARRPSSVMPTSSALTTLCKWANCWPSPWNMSKDRISPAW